MIACAFVILMAASQDAVATPTPTPAPEERRISRKLIDRPESSSYLGGFLAWTGVVMLLLGGALWLLRRFGRGSRLLDGGGLIRVLARRPLGPKQEIFLVEVGAKAFLIGSTRDQLRTLGEFAQPDEVAALRAGREDSVRPSFRESLRERETPVAGASIADELAEIRKTVHAWKA